MGTWFNLRYFLFEYFEYFLFGTIFFPLILFIPPPFFFWFILQISHMFVRLYLFEFCVITLDTRGVYPYLRVSASVCGMAPHPLSLEFVSFVFACMSQWLWIKALNSNYSVCWCVTWSKVLLTLQLNLHH